MEVCASVISVATTTALTVMFWLLPTLFWLLFPNNEKSGLLGCVVSAEIGVGAATLGADAGAETAEAAPPSNWVPAIFAIFAAAAAAAATAYNGPRTAPTTGTAAPELKAAIVPCIPEITAVAMDKALLILNCCFAFFKSSAEPFFVFADLIAKNKSERP